MAETRDAVFAQLRNMGIKFDFVEHAAVRNMEDCIAPAQALDALMPKNLFLAPRNLSAFHLLIVRPEAEFHTSDVSKRIGSSRLSFAPEEKLWQYLHTRPGAISPMGLLFDEARAVNLLMDERLRDERRLAFHPCENDCSIAMDSKDFFDVFLKKLERTVRFVSVE